MTTPDINRIKDYLFSRENLIAAYLFGSCASKTSRTGSDIDIAVLLDNSVNRKDRGFEKLNITNGLIELISFDRVDVVILNDASPLLSHEVLKKGMLLFSKDEKKRVEYTVRETERYLDTICLRRVQNKILHEKIRSGDFGYFKGSRKYSIEKVRKGAAGTSAVG